MRIRKHAARGAMLAAALSASAASWGCGSGSGAPGQECARASDCSLPHATPACSNGTCLVAACDAGFADCDGRRQNGCEVNVASSLSDCGACGVACAPPNATGACVAGGCMVLACTPPFSDCDGDPSNGCECNLQASQPGITVFNQGVPALDGQGVSFPGQANFWDLDGDFALRDGGLRQFAGALALKVGSLEAAAQYFPGDQTFADLTFTLPEFTAADGVLTVAVSGPFTYLGGQARSPIAGNHSAWLASTSASRLSQEVDLTGATAPITLAWQDAGFASAAAVLPGESLSWSVSARAANGTAVVVLPLLTGPWPAASRTADLSTLAGQRVTLTFELRGPAVAMVALDEVSVTAGGPNLVQNGGFETGDLTGWTVGASHESRNVAAGSRMVGGLRVTRTVYAPPSGAWARWVDVYENLGPNDVVTTAWYETTLGSGGNGATSLVPGTSGMAVSSWDTCSASAACRPGTRDVGLAFGAASGVSFATAPDLSGNNWSLGSLVSWHVPLLVPPRGRVALAHFVVMDGFETGLTATSVAARASAIDSQGLAIATGFWTDPQYRAGMTFAQVAAVANWPRQCVLAGECAPMANATPACVDFTCAVGACAAGFADCNGLPGDGCEVALASDPANCSACGNACPAVSHGTPGCAGGVCGIASCAAGWADCDGLAATGCEASLLTDLAHCGSCATPCAPAHATGACAAGTCGIASCAAGWADCNGLPGDGCEVNLATDVQNCGLCLLACAPPNATPACVADACTVAACNTGFGDCNGLPGDGCEVNLATSAQDCGACGTACAYPNATAACQNGACQLVSCLPLFANCNGILADGCEVNTSSDLLNCGMCGRACTVANGTPACTGGACLIAACNAGFADCDANPATGCETGILTDPSNCGGCGLVCSLANATAGCSGGACTVAACTAPWRDCDGLAANGCESNSQTDPLNCGACGAVCPSGVCSAGQCLDKVLVVGAGSPATASGDVQAKLLATGAFAAVDAFDAAAGTPTLAQLQGYQAALVWSNAPFLDPVALGNVLADYFDGGGRVVLAALADTTTVPGLAVAGRFGTPANGYLLIAPAGQDNGAETGFVVVDAASPLLAGVATLSAQMAWKGSGAVTGTGVAAATWQGSGFPLAVTGTVMVGTTARHRADVNLLPPSSAVDPTWWTGDGAALLRNALLYR